jgi:hypothetical protein
MPISEGIAQELVELGSKAQLETRLTWLQSYAVDQVAPAGAELTRAGRRFHLAYNGTVPTGIAPVQAFPTTAAQWAIFNADLVKSHVYSAIGAMLFSGTKGLGGVLLGCIFTLPAQTGFATGLAVASASSSAAGSKASVKSAVAITVPATPIWFPIAEDGLAVATIGPANCMMNRIKEGRIIVPPNSGLGLAVLAPLGTTPLYLPAAEWSEIVWPLK